MKILVLSQNKPAWQPCPFMKLFLTLPKQREQWKGEEEAHQVIVEQDIIRIPVRQQQWHREQHHVRGHGPRAPAAVRAVVVVDVGQADDVEAVDPGEGTSTKPGEDQDAEGIISI